MIADSMKSTSCAPSMPVSNCDSRYRNGHKDPMAAIANCVSAQYGNSHVPVDPVETYKACGAFTGNTAHPVTHS